MTEHTNRNSNRNYPFDGRTPIVDSDGVELAADVFVDAIVYPFGEDGEVRMSSADFSTGSVVVSCGESEYRGSVSGGTVELYSDSGLHFGTIVCGPGIAREMESGRKREFADAIFSSSCVVPVAADCVTRVYSSSGVSTTGTIVFMNGVGRLYSTAGSEIVDGELVSTLRFDVSSRRKSGGSTASSDGPRVVKLIVAARGKTLFSVAEDGSSRAVVTAPGLDREEVCYQAHLEDSVSKVYDTCPAGPGLPCNPCELPEKDERVDLSGCAVSLEAFDLVNYRNPVRISTVGGSFSVDSPRMYGPMSQDRMQDEINRLSLSQIGVGNGIRIDIPGAGL